MGMDPERVDRLSLWQFGVCLKAHNRANGVAAKAKPPSAAQHRERVMRYS
ncbi:MAG: hypothetical protein JWP92_3739 [Caulobacter sp.]|nr:hypothetical protein [Caulobacter sp.]